MLLEQKLLNEDLHISGCALREKGFEIFQSHKEAKEFLIHFLILECISGTNFSRKELFAISYRIKRLVAKKNLISSEELPYNGKQPTSEVKFILKDCTCLIKQL